MKCTDCNYRWQEVGDLYPTCHYQGMVGTAPCEIDDEDEEIDWEPLDDPSWRYGEEDWE